MPIPAAWFWWYNENESENCGLTKELNGLIIYYKIAQSCDLVINRKWILGVLDSNNQN